MSSASAECLILGPEGVGKTLLLRKLQLLCSRSDQKGAGKKTSDPIALPEGVLPTIPTVGTNLEELKLGRNLVCSLREYGGSMAPLWSNAYGDCQMVVYVIDTSRPSQISAATVLLLEVLSSRNLKDKPFLLFFNKVDSPFHMSLVELKSVIRLEDILETTTQQVAVVNGSCATNEGLDDVLQWISERTKQCRRQ